MTTYTYIVAREVVETIEVEASTREEAEQAAAESPVALWTRDIKTEEVVGRINPRTIEAPDLTERDQADRVIGR